MPGSDSESQLLLGAIAGNRESLSQLLLTHYDSLRGFIASRITQELQGLLRADDILHQTMVQVAKSVHRFQPRHAGGFRCWLQTIAENQIKDAERRRRRERRVADPAAIGRGSSLLGMVERLAGEGTTPSDRVQRDDSARRMRIALENLPDEQREVLERYYLKDESLDEIAATMNRTRDAIRGVCYRARKNLRALMGGSSLYFSG